MNETLPALIAGPHPALEWGAFYSVFPVPLDAFASPGQVQDLLAGRGAFPLARPDKHRDAIRKMMRHGGFKPSGRSRPAAEYLARALEEGRLGPINPAVDFCNAVSLHSGIPISVIDADQAVPPFSLGVAPAGEGYVFNPSGQEIRLDGLVVLCDTLGPCGSAAKDSQRTKTGPETLRTLSILWGSAEFADYTRAVVRWYRDLLEEAGVRTFEGRPGC